MEGQASACPRPRGQAGICHGQGDFTTKITKDTNEKEFFPNGGTGFRMSETTGPSRNLSVKPKSPLVKLRACGSLPIQF